MLPSSVAQISERDVEVTDERTFEEAKSTLYKTITKAGVALENASRRRTSTVKAMAAFVDRLQLDISGLSVIHVTGTKGKGSTCALVESILRRQGYKTGLFTSPHLLEVTERIRLDGKPLAKEDFSKYFFEVWDRLRIAAADVDAGSGVDTTSAGRGDAADIPGYFHLLTLVGLWCFVKETVDVCIIEVGMGGRYDATNVVPSPVACGVAMLDLDHTQVLGGTLEKIAWEKGGILKRGCEAFTVEQTPGAMDVLQQCAQEAACKLEVVPPLSTDDSTGATYEIGLGGDHQRINAALALRLSVSWIEKARGQQISSLHGGLARVDAGPIGFAGGREAFMTSSEVHRALAECTWPGRCQVFRPSSHPSITLYLDGAHTEQSMRACLAWFKTKTATTGRIADPCETSRHKRRRRRTRRLLWFNASHERELAPLMHPLATARAHDVENVVVPGDGSSGRAEAAFDDIERAGVANEHADHVENADNTPLFDEVWFVEVPASRPSRFEPASAQEILESCGMSIADVPDSAVTSGLTSKRRSSTAVADKPLGQRLTDQSAAQKRPGGGAWQRTLQQVWLALQARAGSSVSVTGTAPAPHLVENLPVTMGAASGTVPKAVDSSCKSVKEQAIVGSSASVLQSDEVVLSGLNSVAVEGKMAGPATRQGTALYESSNESDVERVEVLCTGSLYVVSAVLDAFGADVV